jgi:hypothetical protein
MVDRKRDDKEIDVQAAKILIGLNQLGDLLDEALQSQEFSSLAEAKLTRSLFDCYQRIANIDPDGWNHIAAERIDALRRYEAEYRRLRIEFERTIGEVSESTSSYFSDVSKNLELLNQVAARVKARAIEPSFQLLAETRASLDDVKTQIRAVEF